MAEVVANNTTAYAKGDLIIYKPYAMTEIKLNGEEHYLIEEQDILGKVVTND